MSWKAVETVSLRLEFVKLASVSGCNMAQLCRRFEVSRKTGYKWLARYKEGGQEALKDRSRAPQNSPGKTDRKVEEEILKLRDKHSAWGARKLRRRLHDVGIRNLPAVSTVNNILVRHGRVTEEASNKARSFTRFERSGPNELWQMDFKGHFPLGNGKRCHPLTILDDYSRYSIGLRALDNEKRNSVKSELISVFRRFGVPAEMLMDNGPPWGTSGAGGFSKLEVWLMMLGIRVIHSRPGHPQTNGKDERFHRTLKVELLQGRTFRDVNDTQNQFNPFRECYNHERPHEALQLDVPASRYEAGTRIYPETIADWDYGEDVIIRKVTVNNCVSFQGRTFKVGQAFRGFHVALQATTTAGLFHVHFRNTRIQTIDLNSD